MMPIKKGLETKQQMSKGELIAEGRTAEVFAWGDHHVLKLYRPWWSPEDVKFEARIGRALYDAGVAAPQVGDIVTVDGKLGLIYERIDGLSMDQVLFAEPQRTAEMASIFARLHAELHRTTLPDFPAQRRRFIYNIAERTPYRLDEPSRQRVLDILASLPDGDSLCHGDLHPGNVLISPAGPRIIDWENACTGSPAADVARAALLLEAYPFYIEAGPNRELLLASVSDFREAYLDEYTALTGISRPLIDAWRAPVATARLQEGIEIEEEFLRGICKEQS
jgi:uncharacterized protein (TIGR02172 family)